MSVRLFTGIALSDDIVNNLSRLIERLRPAAHLRWSAPYNLHITTKFIGEFPEEQLEELKRSLGILSNRRPVPIAIQGLEWLPNPHSPRILFAAVQSGPELAALAAESEEITAQYGIPRERRDFRPHLTLARIKDPGVPLAPLRQAIAALDSTEFGAFVAPGFCLYLSRTGPAGSIYTQLAEIPFAG